MWLLSIKSRVRFKTGQKSDILTPAENRIMLNGERE